MELIKELAKHLNDIDIKWYLCGGLAIDEYIEKQTRTHKDVDITVSFNDAESCIKYLKAKGWIIFAPIGSGRFVEVDVALNSDEYYFDNIWCFKEDADFIRTKAVEGPISYLEYAEREQKELDFIEVMFNKIEKDTFYYDKNHDITMSLDKVGVEKDGILLLAPEIILLHKTRNPSSSSYKSDFDNAFAKLSDDRRKWLLDAMSIEYKDGHQWL